MRTHFQYYKFTTVGGRILKRELVKEVSALHLGPKRDGLQLGYIGVRHTSNPQAAAADACHHRWKAPCQEDRLVGALHFIFLFVNKRMKFFRFILLMVGIYLSLSSTLHAQQPPNILLILSDDHSVPYLGCYGNEDLKTPHLDKLASEGIRFDRAYTCAPQCVPSRASILSGRNVIDIEMSRFSAPLPREVKTIPDYLRKEGYYTGICGRHYHLDGSARMPPETADALKKHNLITFPDRVDFLRKGSDDQVLGQFQEFLDDRPDEKPFFMWMNYSDPHRPFNRHAFEPDPNEITVPSTMPDTKEVRKDLAAHLGEINHLDSLFGLVNKELITRNLKSNTIVIFMGDNGAALLRGKGTLYDLGVHVPLIIDGPGITNSIGSSDALISGDDLAPTILEMAGLIIPDDMTGKSFYPLLKGQPFESKDYIFTTRVPHSSGLPVNTAYFDLSRSVVENRYKLIYNALWKLPYDPVDFLGSQMWKDLQQKNGFGELEPEFSKAFFQDPRPMFELFDLQEDPEEFNNLSGQAGYEEIEHRLKARLHEWMIVYKDYLPLPIPPPKRK